MGEGGLVRPAPVPLLVRRRKLTNVLIVGGTSGQREQVARTFHRESPLSGGPFVRVDCVADQEPLRQALQAWKVAGSGSHTNPFRAAEAGTLYLDDVEELPPDTQPLLLALANRLQGELGGTTDRPGAGRLITGNRRGLSTAVAEGHFDRTLSDALDKVRVDLGPASAGSGNG